MYVYSNTCFTTYIFTVNVANTIGVVSNENLNNDMVVYPNPSGGDFNLILSKDINRKNMTIQVLNMLGEVVKEFAEFENNDTNKHIELNLKEFSSGIYYLKCTSDEKEFIKKIIITK